MDTTSDLKSQRFNKVGGCLNASILMMMSVIEINKRRARFKQTPPGFKAIRINADKEYNMMTNQKTVNSHVTEAAANQTSTKSHVIDCSNDSTDPINITKKIHGKKDFTPILQALKSNSRITLVKSCEKVSPPSHMMPVLEVAMKRAKNHKVPPGFKQLPILDRNNNAKDFNMSNFESGQQKEQISAKTQSNGNEIKVKSGMLVADCIRAVKSEILLTPEEIESLKPECLKGDTEEEEENTTRKKKNKKELKKTTAKKIIKKIHKIGEKYIKGRSQGIQGTIYINAVQRVDRVAGEEVVTNILPFDQEEEEDVEELEVNDVTPVDFLETFDYFEMVSENRKHLMQAIYTVGDLLLANDIKGDKEEWQLHTEKLFEEERAWKKRCREDDAVFERTRRSTGVRQSLKTRVMEYVKAKVEKAKNCFTEACPCFF